MTGGGGGLRALARDLGVQLSFVGIDGVRRRATSEQLRGIVSLLGYGEVTDAQASLVVEERQQARRVALVEPVVVIEAGSPARVPINAANGAEVTLALSYEGGGVHERSAQVIDGEILLEPLAIGRHRLEVSRGQRRSRTTILSSPVKLPPVSPTWGLGAPLYALWRREGPGPVFSDLATIGELAKRHGGSLVGTLPLLAQPSGSSEPLSPYTPSSRRAWDLTYVDPRALLVQLDSPGLRRAITRWEGVSRRADGRFVDQRRQREAVLEALDEAALLLGEHPGLRQRVARLLEADPVLSSFCAFEGRARTGVDLAMAEASSTLGQLLCHEQLSAVATGCDLYLDLPVGVHPAGFDATTADGVFVSGASIGAPPDDLFEGGQSWGCPPPNSEAMRSSGYELFAQSLRHVFKVARVIRIDHVMGLARLYWVPDGSEATDGVYVRTAVDELVAVVAIEASKAGAVVVGEDLGTLPTGLHRTLRRAGFLSSQVFQFEPAPVERRAAPVLASLGTHDLMPFASYLEGRDIDELEARGFPLPLVDRRRLEREARRVSLGLAAHGQLDGGSLRSALERALGQLAAVDPSLMVVDCEDLLYEREPQNRPGTPVGDGNFSRRLAVPIEELAGDHDVGLLLDEVNSMRLAR